MCQYSAEDGTPTDWHLAHYTQLALGGAGLLICEATNVEARGRITHQCTGLYSDENEAGWRRVLAACRKYGNAKIGLQVAHAGRKASVSQPWRGNKPLTPEEAPWSIVSASPIAFADGYQVPHALSVDELQAVKQTFVDCTLRAQHLGFDLLELHAAHGYLMHQFFSPLSNQRKDQYGGSLENRMRFPLEVFAAMRAAWPADKPLGARISGTDWFDGGADIEDAVVFAAKLKQLGCDFVDVTSGGLVPNQKLNPTPGYNVPFAARIKREVGIATVAVGLITEPQQAEEIIASGAADFVALARGMLFNPRWAWKAALELGAEAAYPPQYARAKPAK